MSSEESIERSETVPRGIERSETGHGTPTVAGGVGGGASRAIDGVPCCAAPGGRAR